MKRTQAKTHHNSSFKVSLSAYFSSNRAKLPSIIIVTAISIAVGVLSWALISQHYETEHSKAVAMAQTAALGVSPVRQKSVQDAKGMWLATFTYGSRTVITKGPERVFAESATTSATVTSTTWVRLYPTPFDGTVDQTWLDQTIKDNNQPDASTAKPDILAMEMQYVTNAPAIKDASGKQIAGDASYGPLKADGKRQEGSDFNDYMGIKYSYSGTAVKPKQASKLSMDCSGYQRMVWGYRGGVPIEGSLLDPTGSAIPRRAYQILYGAPGIIITPNTDKQIIDFKQLQAGDIVFFDASTNDGTQIDHMGVFLGMDSNGHYRFISSRKTADGPTMGDVGGKSILDGNGFYAASFRAIRRF